MKKFLFWLICLSSIVSTAMEPKFPGKLNKCTISKRVMNDYEPEEFQPSNNLLRKSGQEPRYEGTKIIIKGRLLDQNCVPVSDAKIYLWQVGSDGRYPYNKTLRTKVNRKMLNLTNKTTFTGSGIATTNNKGEFYFLTIYPGKNLAKGASVNVRVEHRDLGSLQTKLQLTAAAANRDRCGENNHLLANIVETLTFYDFNIVMPGKTLRRY